MISRRNGSKADAGAFLALSYLFVPAILTSPTDLALRQWRRMFDVAKPVHAGVAMVSSLCCGYLAYRMQGTLNQRKAELFGLSALTSLSVLPLYLVVMASTNNALLELSDQVAKGAAVTMSDHSVKELMDRWGLLNAVRGGIMIVSGLFAIWAQSA